MFTDAKESASSDPMQMPVGIKERKKNFMQKYKTNKLTAAPLKRKWKNAKQSTETCFVQLVLSVLNPFFFLSNKNYQNKASLLDVRSVFIQIIQIQKEHKDHNIYVVISAIK